jgi:hypothetical protein
VGKTSPESRGWHWKDGSRVRVFFLKGSFTESESKALSIAINNWNSALGEIDSHVSFLSSGERDNISAAGEPSVTIFRGTPRKSERLGEIKFHSVSNGAVHLTVTISPVVTELKALTSLLTHEIGHSLGLSDCYECKRGTTAMSAFKGDNEGNNVFAPSECDKYVVAAGYASQTIAQAGPRR